jgi:hypothetical protein
MNIIGFIKKQRFNWFGHVERMTEDNNVQKIKRWKPMSKRIIRRPKTRWENDVLEDIRNMNIIGFIKKQRFNWFGHVERMTEDNNVQKIKRWKPMSKRIIGRPKTLWEDDVLEDIKSMNVSNWNKVAQNRGSWKKVVEQARTPYTL